VAEPSTLPLLLLVGGEAVIGALLRLPLALVGCVVDALIGPDELAGMTWPSTTPTEDTEA
jgi:hypothetical protein